jgi:hypothetical protein
MENFYLYITEKPLSSTLKEQGLSHYKTISSEKVTP